MQLQWKKDNLVIPGISILFFVPLASDLIPAVKDPHLVAKTPHNTPLASISLSSDGVLLTAQSGQGDLFIVSPRTLKFLGASIATDATSVAVPAYDRPFLMIENGELVRRLRSERSSSPVLSRNDLQDFQEPIRYFDVVSWQKSSPNIVVCDGRTIGSVFQNSLEISKSRTRIVQMKAVGKDVFFCDIFGRVSVRNASAISQEVVLMEGCDTDRMRSISVDSEELRVYVCDHVTGHLAVFDGSRGWSLMAERVLPETLKGHQLSNSNGRVALWNTNSIILIQSAAGAIDVMFALQSSDVDIFEDDSSIVGVAVLDHSGSFVIAFSDGLLALWNSPIDEGRWVAPDWPRLQPVD